MVYCTIDAGIPKIIFICNWLPSVSVSDDNGSSFADDIDNTEDNVD
jgi:hypothetical protein